jgi:hypothetical protein
MDWFKLTADFYRDPALRAADREVRGARDLFLNGLGYCAEQETHGRLPEHALSTLDVPTPIRKVAALVRHGLLLPEDGGWVYRSWDRHQSEMDALIRRQKSDRERKRLQRERERSGQSADASEDMSRDSHVTVQVLQEQEQKEEEQPLRSAELTGTPLALVPADPTPDPFDDFWDAWPRKVAKPRARKAYAKALRDTSADVILAAACRFRDDPQRKHRPIEYTPHPATWLNDRRWEDEAPSAPAVRDAMDYREVAVRTDW